VRAGRKKEFSHFERFRDPKNRDRIPDPTSPATVESARLDWSKLTDTRHEGWLDLHQRLLAIRQRDIVPLVPDIRFGTCSKLESGAAFAVDWALADGSVLHLIANLADEPTQLVGRTAGRLIYATHPNIRATVTRNELAPWSVTWLLERGVIGG
jgi:1,4-alpha-glucan branching enzyme